jgi:AcrR family transcriptional regulator
MKKGEETRAAIVDQALASASVTGLNGLSIGRLASQMDLSKSGLFSHFGSKEALQVAVIHEVVERFIEQVIRPSFAENTGVRRLEALFDNWIQWSNEKGFPGGCPLIAASIEFDDQPGMIRDHVLEQQQAWLDCIERMAKKAVQEGAFRSDLVLRQFAFELNAIGLGLSNSLRLMKDGDAGRLARTAFQRLMDHARGNSTNH